MLDEKEQNVSYTLEHKTKQKLVNKIDVKKLIWSIMLIILIAGASCALAFGISIAKDFI